MKQFISDQRKYIFEEMPVARTVLTLALPTILSQLVTMVYNLADTFFIGLTGDPVQVASITLGTPLFMLLNAFGSMFGVGSGSQISRLLGYGRPQDASRVCSFGFYACIATTGVYSLLILIFCRPIVQLLGASNQTLAFSMSYLTWTVALGGIPTALSMMLAHVLRSEGLAKKAGFGIALGGVLNVILDWLFITLLFESAVAGAAVATMISNVVVVAYFLLTMARLKGTVLSVRLSDCKVTAELVRPVFKVGIPAALQGLLLSVSNVLVNGLAATYGDIAIAAMGIGKKIDRIPLCVGMGLSQGILPVVAYNFASGNRKRMRDITRTARFIGIGFSAICILFFEWRAESIVRLFINEPETVRIGAQFVRISSITLPLMIISNLLNTFFQAMGRGAESLITTCCRRGFLYIPLIYLFNGLWGLVGLIASQPAADILGIGITYYFYIKLAYDKPRQQVAA